VVVVFGVRVVLLATVCDGALRSARQANTHTGPQ
jgi:hypothetical protein